MSTGQLWATGLFHASETTGAKSRLRTITRWGLVGAHRANSAGGGRPGGLTEGRLLPPERRA